MAEQELAALPLPQLRDRLEQKRYRLGPGRGRRGEGMHGARTWAVTGAGQGLGLGRDKNRDRGRGRERGREGPGQR